MVAGRKKVFLAPLLVTAASILSQQDEKTIMARQRIQEAILDEGANVHQGREICHTVSPVEQESAAGG
jgi:hypothetical protein